MGLCKTLQISVGSRVEISTNIDVEDGLSNGACGEVMTVSNTSNSFIGATIWIKFDSEDIGKKLRLSAPQSLHIRNKWTPITQIKRQFPVGSYKNAEVLRAQFPLRPAAAKTAHRCQGDTMYSAVVDFKGRPQCHAHYVALSRVRTLNNLHVLTMNETTIRVSNEVTQEMERLESSMSLCHTVQFPNKSQSGLLLIFQNICTLKPNLKNIENNSYYLSADILIFAETCLTDLDTDQTIALDGYHVFRHDNIHPGNPMYGIIVYSRLHFSDTDISYHRKTFNNALLECVVLKIYTKKVSVIGVYASPKVTKSAILSFLNQFLGNSSVYTIILGDFNIDLNYRQPIFPESVLKQYIQLPTTEHTTLIDHIYTDIPKQAFDVGVFETYFSDHKPIWASIKDTL